MNIFNKICWHYTNQADILIYDSEGSEHILYCMPLDSRFNILNVRNGVPLINSVSFFLRLIINIINSQNLKIALLKSFIDLWSPKVVITFIDNSHGIMRIKQLFPNIPVISVQNGTRVDMMNKNSIRLNFDNYYCFGLAEIDIIEKFGHAANIVNPIGSLRLGIFNSQVRSKSKNNDICFISEYVTEKEIEEQPNQWIKEQLIEIKRVEKSLFEITISFAEANKLSLCVAMRQSIKSSFYLEEVAFFSRLTKLKLKFIPRYKFSSYEAVKTSRLSVCIFSTLGYEGLGMNARVIFAADIILKSRCFIEIDCNNTPNIYTYRLPELVRLRFLNYEEFSLKANELLEKKENDYINYIFMAKKYYMNSDSKMPQEIIKQKIQSYIG
jgi:surface carbohydrate biosynthesis protein